MRLSSLDHVNIKTSNLDVMAHFYEDVMGLPRGERPPFSIPGAWLYCGAIATVHLVGIPDQPDVRDLRIEHFAFKAEGLGEFLAHLRARSTAYSVSIAPGRGIKQVNLYDPDGNHIEVQFPAEEDADVSPYDGAEP